MYLTLSTEDLLRHLLTVNFLRKRNIQFVAKQQHLFIKQTDYGLVNEFKDVYIQSFESADPQVKYWFLANHVPPTARLVNTIWECYRPKNYQYNQDFIVPKSRYVFNGATVGLYFTGSLISNPLDLLWEMGMGLNLKQEYHSIFYDFFPVEGHMVFEIVFHFSGKNFTEKFQEILNTKVEIERRKFLQATPRIHGFPEIYQQFQKEYFSQYPKESSYSIKLLDSVVYLPEADETLHRLRTTIKRVG